jgi:hypothetical protein
LVWCCFALVGRSRDNMPEYVLARVSQNGNCREDKEIP